MKIFSGFSHIGHIIHVNLRENLLPYKNVIGQILLDKIASCRFLLFISCFIAKLKCSSATADEGEIVFRIFFYIYILKCRKWNLALDFMVITRITNNDFRTVVNKLNIIENEYRCFEPDLLAGEANYETVVKENKITYKLDFSKVHWSYFNYQPGELKIKTA